MHTMARNQRILHNKNNNIKILKKHYFPACILNLIIRDINRKKNNTCYILLEKTLKKRQQTATVFN